MSQNLIKPKEEVVGNLQAYSQSVRSIGDNLDLQQLVSEVGGGHVVGMV